MKKLLLGIAVLALVATGGSFWLLYNSLDSQVASAIRRYGSEITGVPVNLSSAHIAIADIRATLRGRNLEQEAHTPDLHLQSIGKKSNGVTTGEALGQILGPVIQQVGISVASLGLNTVCKTSRKG